MNAFPRQDRCGASDCNSTFYRLEIHLLRSRADGIGASLHVLGMHPFHEGDLHHHNSELLAR